MVASGTVPARRAQRSGPSAARSRATSERAPRPRAAPVAGPRPAPSRSTRPGWSPHTEMAPIWRSPALAMAMVRDRHHAVGSSSCGPGVGVADDRGGHQLARVGVAHLHHGGVRTERDPEHEGHGSGPRTAASYGDASARSAGVVAAARLEDRPHEVGDAALGRPVEARHLLTAAQERHLVAVARAGEGADDGLGRVVAARRGSGPVPVVHSTKAHQLGGATRPASASVGMAVELARTRTRAPRRWRSVPRRWTKVGGVVALAGAGQVDEEGDLLEEIVGRVDRDVHRMPRCDRRVGVAIRRSRRARAGAPGAEPSMPRWV